MGPSPSTAAVRWAVRRVLRDARTGASPAAFVLVACSGGADSLALAAASAFEAPRVGVRVGAVTVDHGLQAGSADRASRTAATLRDLALDPVLVVRADVGRFGGRAGGPEAAARTARYAALDDAAERNGAAAVLLAHSRDDQAETVLLGLARGSGTRSLAGMPAETGRYRRPLLGLSRATLRQACADADLEPWDDPHNDDPRFARVRVRREVLPVLEAQIGPGIAAALARTAGLLRDDAAALDEWAERAVAACTVGPGQLGVRALLSEPAAVRRRVLRAAALAAGSPPKDLTAGHLAALDELLTDWHGQGPLTLPGRVAARRNGLMVSVRRVSGAASE